MTAWLVTGFRLADAPSSPVQPGRKVCHIDGRSRPENLRSIHCVRSGPFRPPSTTSERYPWLTLWTRALSYNRRNVERRTGDATPRQKVAPVISQMDEAIPEKRIRRSEHVLPLASILAAVMVANLGGLLHLVTTNPLVLNADLASAKSGWLPGLPYIDGNAGFTTQALGHLAILDWFHGHIPWWNPYEGVGSPLAGEMQSGAFFPPTILLVLHQGVFLLQLTLEVVSGWSTYFLVRNLGVGRSFSTAAGVAFGLCGTFAWLAHAPIRPAALLPLSLLGVERAVGAAKENRPGGWRLLAVALALSISAGFPETCFIDGLFVALWSILRIAGAGRSLWRPIIGKLASGVAVAVALAAPLLVAFADYLPYGYIGGHGQGFAHVSLPESGLSQLILPYSLGPIFGFRSPPGASDTITLLWGSVGGFLSVTVVAAGLVGLIGSRQRLLRLGLGGWILVCLLRTFGFPPIVHVFAAIPGVRFTAFYRYSDPSWELAAVVLAVLGLDDIARNVSRRRAMVGGTLITGALAIWAGAHAWSLMTHAIGPPGSRHHAYPVASLAMAIAALSALAVGALMAGRRSVSADVEATSQAAQIEHSRRRGRVLMAGVVGAESILLMGFTYLSAPVPTPLQLGSVGWLQAHLGTYRFLTLGPIQPNYGSYFGIAEASINDLPVPRTWNTYIADHLDPNAIPAVFSGGGRINPAGPTPAQELTANLSSYEAVGIRYVVERSSGRDAQGRAYPVPGTAPWPVGPREVYRDGFAEIWQLPSSAPVFSLRVPGVGAVPGSCAANGVGWDRAKVHCSRRSVLIRRVQFMPGWTATGNGVSMAVHEDTRFPSGLIQEVSLPAGTTTVQFTFLPPHEDPAIVVAVVALVVLLGSVTARDVRRRRRRSPGTVRPAR